MHRWEESVTLLKVQCLLFGLWYTWLSKSPSAVGINDTDQTHCNYAPQWLRCRHSIPDITSDSQTHILITFVVCRQFPHGSPDGCQLYAERKKINISLAKIGTFWAEGWGSVWKLWNKKGLGPRLELSDKSDEDKHVSGKDFVKTGEEAFWLGFYNITHTFKRSPESP